MNKILMVAVAAVCVASAPGARAASAHDRVDAAAASGAH